MLGIEGAAIGFALLLFLLFIGLHIATSLFLVALAGAWIFSETRCCAPSER